MRIMKNAHGEQPLFSVPCKPNGDRFTYELVSGSQRVYADTPRELVSYMIPGYEGMNEEDRLVARIRHALGTAARLQAVINDLHSDAPRTIEEDAALTGVSGVQVDVWDCEIPIVLVDALYAPVTNLDRPVPGTGPVLWLEPTDEFTYLVSLHSFGVVTVNMSLDKAV